MTTHEKMKKVLMDSGEFTEEQIDNVLNDAQVGAIIRASNDDDDNDNGCNCGQPSCAYGCA